MCNDETDAWRIFYVTSLSTCHNSGDLYNKYYPSPTFLTCRPLIWNRIIVFQEAVTAPWVLHIYSEECRREFLSTRRTPRRRSLPQKLYWK